MKKTEDEIDNYSQAIIECLIGNSKKICSLYIENKEIIESLIVKHGVAGLIYEELKKGEFTKDYDFYEFVKKIYFVQKIKLQFQEKQTEIVIDAFKNKNLRYIILKGQAISHEIYDYHEQRNRTDVDIYLREKDSNIVKEIMESHGFYNPRGWFPKEIVKQFTYRKTFESLVNIDFDFHTKINNDFRINHILTFEYIYSNSHLSESGVRRINWEAALSHAILHLLSNKRKNNFVKIIWLYDIYLILYKSNIEQMKRIKKEVEFNKLELLYDSVVNDVNRSFKTNFFTFNNGDKKYEYILKKETRIDGLKILLLKIKKGGIVNHLKELVIPPIPEITNKYGEINKMYLPFYYLHRLLNSFKKNQ